MAVNRIKPENLSQWLQQPSTRRLLALEAGWLRDWVCQLHGCHLLYVGVDPEPRFLKRSRTQHQFRFGISWSEGVTQDQAHIQDDAWPLADESVDVVVLQHSLDLSSRPHQLIREAVRCLVPNGYLIVAGFNPLSLWGGARWLRSFSTDLPWVSNPVAPSRLTDWLTLLDMRVEQRFHCAHLWPVSLGSERLNRRIDRVMAGNQLLPSNAYVIVARKTVAGMTPIRPRRWQLSDAAFGLPLATASRMPIKRESEN